MLTSKSHTAISGFKAMLIVVGGLNNEHQILSSIEIFDSITRQWHTCSDNLPRPHYLLQSVVINNALYVLGGISQNQKYSLSIFVAQLNTPSEYQLKWESYQQAPWQASAPVSVLCGTYLLLIGESNDIEGGGYRHHFDVHVFNEATHCWEIVGDLPLARAGSAAASIADDKVFVFGGVNDKGHATYSVRIGSCE